MLKQLKAFLQNQIRRLGYEVRRKPPSASGRKGRRVLTRIRGIIQKQVFGYRMNLDLSEMIQFHIATDTFEPVESAWVQDYLEPGMTFIDVGANVGYFSLLAARLVGEQGRVVAFEPSPRAASRLMETIEANQIGQIKVEQCALGDAPGQLPLILMEESCHSPSLVPQEGIELGTVDVVRLDDYLIENGIQHIDLIKIDVEGFEPNVLRGLECALKSGEVGAILCELNDWWLKANGEDADSLHRLILSFGFQPFQTENWPDSHSNTLYIREEVGG